MNSPGRADRIALRVLRQIHEGASANSGRVVVIALESLPPDHQVTDPAHDALVRLLLRQWDIADPDIARLERVWREALEQAPDGVGVRRLRELAKDCSSGFYEVTEEAEAWQLRLSNRLTQLGLPACTDASAAADDSDVLFLGGVGQEWPGELLNGEQYRLIPSLLPDQAPLPLDGAWVELQFVDWKGSDPLRPKEAWPAPREQRALQDRAKSITLRQLLRRLDKINFVIGDPGGGKSTLVNWIARETIRDRHSPFLLPLIVRLREYGLQQPGESILTHALRKCGVRSTAQIELWTHALNDLGRKAQGEILLLLDGLDELPRHDSSVRQRVLDQVAELAARGMTVLITSRPSAAPSPSYRRKYFRITELPPWGVEQLVDRWCHSAKMPPDAIGRLKTEIESKTDLARMAGNPFLLTCLCSLAASHAATREALPTRRYDIYARCLKLIQAQSYPRQTRRFVDSDMRRMGRLAYWLLRDAPSAPRLVFDVGDIQAACGETQFFHDVVEPSRLVSQWDVNDASLYLSHASFHEFLAAEHMGLASDRSSDGIAEDELRQLLKERAFFRTWTEVFAFLGARDTTPSGAFWENARSIASRPDRFGGVLIVLARWLKEAGVKDGGAALLGGRNLLEELWQQIFIGTDPPRFMAACAQLDPSWFAKRFEAASASDEIGEHHREFLRILKQVRLPFFSRLFVDETLSPHSQSNSLPQMHRLSSDSLARLRQELESGRHDERVSQRGIQVLGLSRDYPAVPLLAGWAMNPGPLQSTAIEALGLVGGPDAFERLELLMSQDMPQETWALAVQALGNMHEERAHDRLMTELAGLPQEDERASEVLCAIQDHALSADDALIVLDYLHSSHPETRDYAACVLYEAKTTPRISEELARVARSDPAPEVRAAALLSFEHHVRAEDFGWLQATVRNEELDSEEREAALMAMGDLYDRDPDLAPALENLLDYTGTQKGMEKTTINIRGRLGVRNSGPLLDTVLAWLGNPSSGNDVVIEEACRVIGELSPPDGLDLLLRILRDSRVHARVREAAALGVTRMAPERLVAEPDEIAQRILGRFSLETGRLIFGDTMIEPEGPLSDVVFGIAQVNAATTEVGMPAATYEKVLDIVRSFGRGLERGSDSSKQLGEEALRDLFVSNLNTHYAGAVAGEAFQKSGKTDIRIMFGNRSAFIGECKIWGGAKALEEAIYQLESYLPWRDDKVAIILFNQNNKDLTALQTKLAPLLAAHPLHIRPLIGASNEGEWRHLIRSSSDPEREITVHIFLFDLVTGGRTDRSEV